MLWREKRGEMEQDDLEIRVYFTKTGRWPSKSRKSLGRWFYDSTSFCYKVTASPSLGSTPKHRQFLNILYVYNDKIFLKALTVIHIGKNSIKLHLQRYFSCQISCAVPNPRSQYSINTRCLKPYQLTTTL